MIRAYLLTTGKDGNSHVVPGRISEKIVIGAESIMFQETPAGSHFDWHDAPTTQYVITLDGTLEFTNHDGTTFTIKPGDILIAEDTKGTGHKWRLVDDQPWRRAYVVFPEGTDVQFVPDEA